MRHLLSPTLKTRLLLAALMALVLSLVPTALLLRQDGLQLASLQREQAALPANQAWQALLRLQRQQRELAAEAQGSRPAARQELAAVQQAMAPALAALREVSATPRHREAVEAQAAALARLEKSLADGPLDLSRLLAAQQDLALSAWRAMDDLNEEAGLPRDPDPASQQALLAGLQAAPRVEEALSELGAIARAAAVDDLAALTAAMTRYREHANAMQEALQRSLRAGGSLTAALASVAEQTAQQREQLEQVVRAATLDPSYPLEQLAQGFAAAAQVQARLSSQVLKTLDQSLQARADQTRQRRNLLLIALPLLLAALGWLMLRTMNQVLRPLQAMVDVTERIAAGDLSQPVPEGRSDELGRVLQALAHMQRGLRSLVRQINEGAGSIRSAADEIATGNLDLSRRTEQAAAQLQQTAASVALLDQTVGHSSAAALQATQLSAEASTMALNGGQVVERVVATMGAIQQSSSRIADITGLIDGIAFQTNLLALNAAVEAARAGEQGRGFAVVASEVRQLSQRSAEAARDIRGLLRQSVEQVEGGTALAAEAGVAMRRIVHRVGEVSAVVRGLAGQASEQAGQTRELGQAMKRIDAMTQQNAALVEQSAASAASLRGRAQTMDQTVQAFSL
ncbi:methyl-accepting chemotaxis protein [Roseateles microcysteis]|uniref:methyl-accepting chemotaxis protein n=1 Tax=Roseateles microcysteis TaxID=3119057 RepID=UPI002FE51CAE